ncbi:MAG: hypothetical protein OEZ59_06020 [Deltaproteobacteria bacterium]|nr:hypothetical protein [Deltaproteobacteria bacterium]
MTENKLEGFEDFENILGDADSGGDAELSGGLDDILGDSGGAPPGTAMEEGDSELDSFFEDLSTIDDLEVLQDEEEMVPAPEGPMEQAHADEDEEEEEEYEPAPAVQKEKAKPAKAAKPAKEKTGPGFITRTFKRIVLLTLLAVVGYAAYWVFTLVFFSEGEAPKEWGVEEVVKDVEKAVKELTPPEKPPVAEAPPELPPEPPPQLEPEPPPRPKPRPSAPRRLPRGNTASR